MNAIEAHAMAYYAATDANDLNITDRWYPYGELQLIIADKISVAARKFGSKVTRSSREAATGFVDYMIERGAWATTENKFGGRMHQFQPAAYKAALKELQASDPILQQAAAGGESFWTDSFAALTA